MRGQAPGPGTAARKAAGKRATTNLLTVDLEDYYCVTGLADVAPVERWAEFESRVERSTEILLEALSVAGTLATFFVLGWVAEKHPGLVKTIAWLGHEIATHGTRHRLLTGMKREDFARDLEAGKKRLEDVSGREVIGHRAPSFSITEETPWAFEVMAWAGLRYDSSVVPLRRARGGIPGARLEPYFVPTERSEASRAATNKEEKEEAAGKRDGSGAPWTGNEPAGSEAGPERKKDAEAARGEGGARESWGQGGDEAGERRKAEAGRARDGNAEEECGPGKNRTAGAGRTDPPERAAGEDGAGGIWEFPIAVWNVIGRRVPTGGGFLRLYPYWMTRVALERINGEGRPAVLYVHPWECDPGQPRLKSRWTGDGFRHYYGLGGTIGKLRRLLNDFRFAPIRYSLEGRGSGLNI